MMDHELPSGNGWHLVAAPDARYLGNYGTTIGDLVVMVHVEGCRHIPGMAAADEEWAPVAAVFVRAAWRDAIQTWREWIAEAVVTGVPLPRPEDVLGTEIGFCEDCACVRRQS